MFTVDGVEVANEPSAPGQTIPPGLLESVLRQYPEEKELHERVRLYLSICQRQATQKETAPQTIHRKA